MTEILILGIIGLCMIVELNVMLYYVEKQRKEDVNE